MLFYTSAKLAYAPEGRLIPEAPETLAKPSSSLETPEKPCSPLETPEKPCCTLEMHGKPHSPPEAPEKPCYSLEMPGKLCSPPETPEKQAFFTTLWKSRIFSCQLWSACQDHLVVVSRALIVEAVVIPWMTTRDK